MVVWTYRKIKSIKRNAEEKRIRNARVAEAQIDMEKYLYPLVYKTTITLEVDGKQVILSRNIGCKLEVSYNKWTKKARVINTHTTLAMSHALPEGDVIITSAPRACHRFFLVMKMHMENTIIILKKQI